VVPEVRGEQEVKRARAERVDRPSVVRSTTPARLPSTAARSRVTTPGAAPEAGVDRLSRAVPVDQEAPVVPEAQGAIQQEEEVQAATAVTPDHRPLVALAVSPQREGLPKAVPSTARAPWLPRAVSTRSRARVRRGEPVEAEGTVAWAEKEMPPVREEVAGVVVAGRLQPSLVSLAATVDLEAVLGIPVGPPLGRTAVHPSRAQVVESAPAGPCT
jgi:hypothetical protein